MQDIIDNNDKIFVCEKCGKEKKRSEGNFVLGGAAFCCRQCCGDPKDAKSKKASAICEFC